MQKKFSIITCLMLGLHIFFFPGWENAQAEELAFPRILSVSPQPGAHNVALSTDVTVSFNTAMDKRSTEESFHLLPETEGRFSWHQNALTFSPVQPLLPSTTYFLTFAPAVQSAEGIPFAVTYFQTPAVGLVMGPAGKIHTVNPENGRARLLRSGESPVWANDNRSIIFVESGQLHTFHLYDSKTEQLTQDFALQAATPQCNTQNDIIAFVGTNPAGIANIYAVDITTKAVRQLTAFFEIASITMLHWSPDGLYIAFLREGQIWIMNQDGTNLRKLTNDELPCTANFAWSPGGTKIAFTGEGNVWVGDIYSLVLRKISFDDPDTGWLDWSQGNKIAFESRGIVVMNADGSQEQRIITAGKRPVWIGNGEQLGFFLPLDAQAHTYQLWKYDLSRAEKRKCSEISLIAPHISWSRNIFNQRSSP